MSNLEKLGEFMIATAVFDIHTEIVAHPLLRATNSHIDHECLARSFK